MPAISFLVFPAVASAAIASIISIEKGEKITFEEVLRDIQARDHNDMTRALNPLKKADDALEVDSTGMDIEEVTETILKEIK